MKTLSFILLILGWVTGLSAQHHHNHETGLNASEINAEHSLYHLDVDWIDHRGDTYTLSDFRAGR
ncbi:MAG: hypothetical protein U5K69_00390 [Balneolaceae bacterium]|nr:hypothetical protein [Balneolaceae bacterium]